MSQTPRLDAAETFIWLNARLVDRHRYSTLFKNGDPDAVVAALQPYQNPDGGFGHALEPDGRGPDSQPLHVHSALLMLDEVGRFDTPIVRRAIEYLASVTTPNGGVPSIMPSARAYPRAPWWRVESDTPPGSLLPTAGLVGLLHKNGVKHPWLGPAEAFCWQAISAVQDTHPYEVEFCLAFLDHASDRARAEREAERIGRLVREQRLVLLDPARSSEVLILPGYAPDEVHTPLDYAMRPASLARGWFSDAEIELALDALAGAQADDGGWSFNWRAWNPATTMAWRGWITLRALGILRAYGRLS
jgi:hypothetical protein